ncbi:MAG: fibronectin type III domain-containing protein [Acidimicrobiia bacterium]
MTDFGGLNDPDHIYMTLMDGDTAVAGHGGDAASPFELSAPAGTYTLTLQAASEEDGDDWEYRPEDDWTQVSVEDFSLHQDRTVDLRLPLVGFPVTVLDADGASVADAWVESENDGTAPTTGEPFPGAEASGSFRSHRWTDASGVATLRVLPGVPFTVLVDPPGGRGLPKEIHIPGTATGAEVRVDDAPTLQGHVRSTEGLPIRPQHGWLVPDSGPHRPFTFGPDGAYAVSALPGHYRIKLDTFEEFYRPSEDEDAWRATTTGSIEITGDTMLDLTVPWYAGAEAWAVDADGWADSGEFDNGFTGSSVVDFELAPGLFASSTFSVWGPGTFESLSAGSVLAPSRTKTYFNPDEGPTILLPRLYLAPKEDTVVAQLGRWRGPAAPQDVRAFGDIDGTATVSWAPPATDRGSPVLGYMVTANGNRETRRLFVPAPSTSTAFSGLATSESYVFWVMAVSARGTSNSNGMRILIPGPALPPTPQPGNPPPSPTTPKQTGGTGTPPAGSPTTPDPAASGASVAGRSGYWMLESDGHVYAFGDAAHLGDAGQRQRGADAVDLEPTPSGAGYWILDHRGAVSAHGDATHHGDVNRAVLATGETATSLSATPTAQGYWVFTSRGRVLPFGDATFLGDMSTVALNGPVLDSIPTPTGRGYYMVASDGGIFTFGDAHFAGSMGDTRLNAPVQSLVPDIDGAGYWLVAADGGIFSFDAPFRGSMGAIRLNKPVTGMVRHGNGYLMVGEDGGIFNFSNQPFSGSLGDRPPARPIVSVAAVS